MPDKHQPKRSYWLRVDKIGLKAKIIIAERSEGKIIFNLVIQIKKKKISRIKDTNFVKTIKVK